jgi:hypothetical protein
LKRVPFLLCSLGLIALTVVWSVESGRVVYVVLFAAYLGIVALTGVLLGSPTFKHLVKRRTEYGTEFFVWFFVFVNTLLLAVMVAGALGLIGESESSFTWRVAVYVFAASCISSFHGLFTFYGLTRGRNQ